MRWRVVWLFALIGFCAHRAAATPPACCSADGHMSATSCGASAEDDLDDSAALNLALQCPAPDGTPVVYFQPGRYVIAAPVTSALDDLTVVFGAGAVLDFRGAGLTLTGARTRVGGFRGQLATATASAFEALRIEGRASIVDGVRFEVTAEVPSATLLRIAGARVHATDVQILGDARSFAYGVHVASPTGAEVPRVRIDGLDAELDPHDAHRDATFGALLYLRASQSQVRDLAIWEGSRMQFPDGVVVVDGHGNTFEAPNMTVPGAQYGIYRKYGAEFLNIESGRLDGTGGGPPGRVGSEGIYNSQFAGHLKAYGTSIIGWDYGVGFHGSHDTPNLVGTAVANNGTAGILVDSYYSDTYYGAGDWPVSGLVVSGNYYEEKADPQEAFILLRSGSVQGLTVTGCYIGYASRMLKVESTMGTNGGIVIEGNRFPSIPGGAIVEPGQYSEIWIGHNVLSGSNVQTTGPYASKAVIAAAPGLSSLTLGGSDGPLTGHYRYTFTANFGNALTAGASSELGFSAPAVAPNDSITCTLAAPLASNAALAVSACYVTGWGTVALRLRNVSAVDQTSVAGGLAVDVWKH